ncbi:MAG TPA: TetR/AcrR family transcriptional regulator [Blastocatellia bacterium]|nr:TetR/AcrR family transcriptional regulator [Blastocatellia bacterium]
MPVKSPRKVASRVPVNGSGAAKARTEKSNTILRAAIEVFARAGYFNAKVAEVARAAGVADGTVYLYFKNKDDLLISIFNTMMDVFIAQAQTELAAIDDPREQLRHFARLHLSSLEQDRDLAIVFQVELRQSTKFMEQFSETKLAEYMKILREILERGQKRNVFRAQPNSKLVAKVIFGALDEMATNWVLSHNNYRLTSMVEPLMNIFLNGIGK